MLLAAIDHANLALCLAILSLAATAISLLVVLRKFHALAQGPASGQRPRGKGEAAAKVHTPVQRGADAASAGPRKGTEIGKTSADAGLKEELTAAVVAQLQLRARERRLRLLLLLGSLAVTTGLAETGLRRWDQEGLRLDRDERSLMYRYDAALGWFPMPYSHEHIGTTRPVSVIHNSEGFRDSEHPLSTKPRIVFLGDSFVWGYDVEVPERFTDKLQARHPEWNVYNCGVSGYGTDQELLLLQMRIDEYQPRVVCLIFSTENDGADNMSNVRYGGYYKPYFTVEAGQLRLNGVPVPRGERVFWSEHPRVAGSYLARLLVRAYFKLASPPALTNRDPTGPLIRDMQSYVQSKGADFVIGLTRGEPKFEEYLRRLRILFVDLSTPLRYPEIGRHWTPPGHTFVADKIEELLRDGKYLDPEQHQHPS